MEELLEQGIEAGLIEDAVIAESIEHRNAFLRMREEMPEAAKFEGGSIKHDISVPVAAIPQFLAEADAAVERAVPGSRPAAFGHMGDGNMHYNVSQAAGADTKAYLAQWDAMNAGVFAVVKKFGGSISAEHGIGRLKRDLLPTVKDPVAIEVMRAMKKTLDPNGILNPGKVL
jgi:D-lactate dehydrogenase (cytochrome)